MSAAWGGRATWPALDLEALADDRPGGWIDLAAHEGVFAGSAGVLATVGAQDADGWHTVTVTGPGAVADGAAEMRYLLYPVLDIFGGIADLSTGAYALSWRMEISGPGGSQDSLLMAGPVVMSGTIGSLSAVEGVIVHGWDDQAAGTVRRSSTTGLATSNATTAATTSRMIDALWHPERDAAPQLGGHTAVWLDASGTEQANAQAWVTTSVSRASVWRLALAIGCDSTSTTPGAVSIRLAARALRLRALS